MKLHLDKQLTERGVNPYMVDAMLRRDYPESTDAEINQARGAHAKALRTRDTRLKL